MKLTVVFGFLVGVFVLASCGSTGTVARSSIETAKSPVEQVRIDWKGAALGTEVPDWVEDVVNNNPKVLAKLPQFEGKKVIFAEDSGKNLDVLKSWVNNFNAAAQVSRSISNHVRAKFGGGLSGSKSDPEADTYIEELISTFSQVQLSGLNKELDYWIQMRKIDHDKKTMEDVYHYYVAYSIDNDNLALQIDRALDKVAEKNEKERQLKVDVRSVMLENEVIADN